MGAGMGANERADWVVRKAVAVANNLYGDAGAIREDHRDNALFLREQMYELAEAVTVLAKALRDATTEAS